MRLINSRLISFSLTSLLLNIFQVSLAGDVFWEVLKLQPADKLVRWSPIDPSDQLMMTTSKILANSKNPIVWTTVEKYSPDPDRVPVAETFEQAQTLLDVFVYDRSQFPDITNIGTVLPTANIIDEFVGGRANFFQISTFSSENGTGNQNYVGKLDFGLSPDIQLGFFYSEADDPLYNSIGNTGDFPANFWQSYGFELKKGLIATSEFKISALASIEAWNVGSGGCDSFSCKQDVTASPNIFNDSGERVYSKNVVGSIAFPLTWKAGKSVELTFAPGASFLPATQGAGQGGAGNFYGTNVTLAAGAAWKASSKITLFSAGLMPFGPGTNSFNSNLEFNRVPIITGGLSYAINPRIGLEASLTNGFGGTPATSLLALPSSNQLMYSARFVWNPQAADTPHLSFTSRSRSLTLGGVSVNTALIPPASVVNLWANADDKGNLFGQVGWSVSNDFQFILFDAGAFQKVSPTSRLVSTYANNGGVNQRFGGKAVFLQQLRGDPLTASGAITLGRNYDASSFQGYVFAEAIGTWEANNRLAFNLNPKLAWSGVDTPVGIGLSGNIQLSPSFQLIPEVNAVVTDIDSSNGTISLRWLPRPTTALDVYVSNGAGIYDIGQLLRNDSTRVGAKFTIQL